ncbi:MAG: hydantoinase/oxoprolinase family protein, partial [Planctomyces sp.]
MKILGLDIGGANIKAATADGICVSVHFEIWKSPELLAETLTSKIAGVAGKADLVAVTMTAELADCFDTRTEGVAFIIQCVQQAFPQSLIRIWLTSGEFAEPEDACDLPMLAAASNWNALATWAGRAFPAGPALLLDIGSTTTDISPLLDGFCFAQGTTDLTRLQNSELLYTG